MKKSPPRPTAAPRRLTADDVAEASGCSKATVSRALRDDPRITEEVRAKVKAAAARLGYIPNQIARQLSGRGPRAIAIIVPRTAEFSAFSAMHTATLRGAGRVLSAANSLLLLSMQEERDYADLFQSGLCRGLIVLMNRVGDPKMAALDRSGIPAVLIPGDPTLRLPGINLDNRGGAQEMTAQLVTLGHRHIGLVGGAADSVFHRERLAGVQAAMAALPKSRSSLVVVETNFSEQAGFAVAAELLRDRPGLTALVCINDLVAAGVLRAVAQSGLVVPRDISVVSLSGLPDGGGASGLRLTRVITDLEAVGAAAAETVLAMIDGRTKPKRTRRLPVRIEQGNSVARA